MKFIAFLDILGFNELITHNSLDKIIRIYKDSFANANELMSVLFKMKELDANDVHINCRIVSDSIIIWTSEVNYNSFIKLSIMTNTLFHSLFIEGMPLRGCIEIGELEEINIVNPLEQGQVSSVLVGSGITKAYKNEKLQNWSGCIVSNEAISHVKSIKIEDVNAIKFEELVNIGLLQMYRAPLKQGEIHKYYVLDWPFYFSLPPTEDDIRSHFSKNNKVANTWEVEEKIINTWNFIKYSQSEKLKMARKEI